MICFPSCVIYVIIHNITYTGLLVCHFWYTQEFIKLIQEQGKVFTLSEYERALKLIGRGQQKDVSGLIATLHSMFSDDAI